ncbi:MAG: prephenate dehydrogenase/arogenate dehydrogenase family protein [Planctomycetota bacterium]
MPVYDTVAIVGVGLIGGSVGLALRERELAGEVVGIGRSPASLARAEQRGAVDRSTIHLAEGVAGADVVVVASPVSRVVEHLVAAAEAAGTTQLVTDAASTKGQVCSEVDRQLAGKNAPFVGSHPLAGSHLTGVDAANPDLFENKLVVITPTPETAEVAPIEAEAFWMRLGARVRHMTPEDHDRALAATSHLPHLVASALAGATEHDDLPLTASGWADTTRVAAADPALWTDIFLQNRPAVRQALAAFQVRLDELAAALEAGEHQRIEAQLRHAKGIRDAVGD